MKLQRPPLVQPGAKIAVVSLASSYRPELLPAGLAALSQLGFAPELSPHAAARYKPYFAGTPAERLADLHAAFADPAVAAIICTRGGYGSNYLMAGLDLRLIAENPKPLFAYSDMTNLQCWLLDKTGLPAFHGPMLTADFAVTDGIHARSLLASLRAETYTAGPAEGLRALKPGSAQGVLYGGCLSLLAASLGTPYAVQTEGKLLFIEDVGAKPYQVDRMLRQLVLAGKLEGVTGIVFGEMLDCVSPGASPQLLEEVILSVLADFDGPVGFGLRSGHVSRSNVTLTFGLAAQLDLDGEPALRFLEAATTR